MASRRDGFVGTLGTVKRIPIGAIQPAIKDFVVVSVIVGMTEPRKVIMKKDGSERFVITQTLRDSPSDIINLTLWTSRSEADEISANFKIGSVIEVTRARVQNRDFSSVQESYRPSVTSPFSLSNIEGKTIIAAHIGDWSRFETLLSIPTKATSGYLNISDLLQAKNLVGKNVDLCVAIRTVGPIKSFLGKDGQERKLRDIKLFDITSPCLIMKIWDNNLIQMSDSWLPRDTILFLADVKVSFDTWRGCNTVTCTGKTIITVNPEIAEARALHHYCQTVDFSSHSKMDSIVASFNPESVTKVNNVFSLVSVLKKVYQEKDAVMITNLYGYLTKFDIDQDPVPIVLKCGNCGDMYRKDDDTQQLCCQNIDCKDYRTVVENWMVTMQYNIKVNITDETGTLLACHLRPEVMERSYGIKAPDFAGLSAACRTAYKWDLYLTPLRFSLGIMLRTADRRTPSITVLHVAPASYREICVKMPTPIFQ